MYIPGLFVIFPALVQYSSASEKNDWIKLVDEHNMAETGILALASILTAISHQYRLGDRNPRY